jgi:NAD(P)-dependent dehydrogenase (short-subunit alcohol dehydrogenase family)
MGVRLMNLAAGDSVVALARNAESLAENDVESLAEDDQEPLDEDDDQATSPGNLDLTELADNGDLTGSPDGAGEDER